MTNTRIIGILLLTIGIPLYAFYTWWLLVDNGTPPIKSIFDILWLLILLGGLVYLIMLGMCYFFYLEIFNWRIKKLHRTGMKTTLKIDKIIYKTITAPRGISVRMFSIKATGMNPLTKKEQIFKSKPTPMFILKNQRIHIMIGSDIDIYIYKKNPDKYLVDIRKYLK